jgi:hypothetical protein
MSRWGRWHSFLLGAGGVVAAALIAASVVATPATGAQAVASHPPSPSPSPTASHSPAATHLPTPSPSPTAPSLVPTPSPSALPGLSVAPAPLWVKTLSSSPSQETFLDIARGPGDSIYCAGSAGAHGDVSKLLVARYDASGKLLWKQVSWGPHNRSASLVAAAVTLAGNVVVAGETGTTTIGEGHQDVLVAEFSPTGRRLWTRVIDGPAHGDDWATGVVVDQQGSAYVLASAVRKATGRDYLVVKLASNGRQVWQQWCGGRLTDTPTAIVIDAAHNTYVTGYTWDASPAYATTIRIDPNGRRVWTDRLRLNGAATYGHSLALAPLGRLYVTGNCAGLSGLALDHDMMLARIRASNGAVSWVRQAGLPTSSEGGGDVVVTAAGDAVVAGGGDNGQGCLAWDWNTSGTQVWQDTLAPEVLGTDASFGAVRLDAQGNAYCAGTTDGPTAAEADNFWTDLVVAKYAANGDPLWSTTYNGPHDMRDTCNDMVLTGSGVYLAGSQEESAAPSGAVDSSALLIKYPLD